MKYIDLSKKVEKRYQGKEYIKRYFHLLNILAPSKYGLNLFNQLASIENLNTNLTELTFSDNPFKF